MSNGIYKKCKAVNNKVKQIHVFIGERLIDKEKIDIQKLYSNQPENLIFDNIFNENEKQEIKFSETEVVFINAEIHPDDTIETIKKKYIQASKENDFTYEGIYLFTKTNEKLTARGVYQNLTQNGKISLTRQRFIDFILNIDDIDVSNISKEDEITYEDVQSLNLESRESWIVSKPVGQQFLALEQSFPYTVNPFNVIEYDDFLTKFSTDILSTINQTLLMETKTINNTLYVCSVKDVLTYIKSVNVSPDTTIRIYFPYLYKLGIKTLENYKENEQKLIVETNKIINDKEWLKNVENIDLFYDVYASRKKNTTIIEQGIKEGIITLLPEISYNLPLDIVFKIIHATELNPFIKFNPGKRQEKIYRLYTDKIAVNGK